ncbi:unnamed protein product, partial [Porites evermanni]
IVSYDSKHEEFGGDRFAFYTANCVMFVLQSLSYRAVPAGPTECYSCLENDPATCSANQQVQTCATDRGSLGTTHCGFRAGIYGDEFGNTNYGVMRGCINCADKRQASERTFGYLKALLGWTLLQCEIECCTGDKYNTGTVPTLPTPGSDKAQACERVYGYVRALLGWTVLQCEIECCTGDKCNTGTFPTVPTSGSGGSKNTEEQVTGVLAFAAASVIIWHHF